MLECWQEHPADRPSFSELRKKFSDLLLAKTGDAYMELEVDEAKVYYTMGEEEEKDFKARRDSVSSDDSDSSIKKPKGKKKIEKPKWAQNPYVPTPSTFKDDHVHIDDEHYRVRVDVVDEEEEKIPDEITALGIHDDKDKTVQATKTAAPSHTLLAGTLSSPAVQVQQQTAVLLEDQMGIPLSFIASEKPPTQSIHQAVQPKKSNPYGDDPFTKQLLVDVEREPAESSKLGSLSVELGWRMAPQGDKPEDITAL